MTTVFIDIDLKPMLAGIEALQRSGYVAGVEDINHIYVMAPVAVKGRVEWFQKVLLQPQDVASWLEDKNDR